MFGVLGRNSMLSSDSHVRNLNPDIPDEIYLYFLVRNAPPSFTIGSMVGKEWVPPVSSSYQFTLCIHFLNTLLSSTDVLIPFLSTFLSHSWHYLMMLMKAILTTRAPSTNSRDFFFPDFPNSWVRIMMCFLYFVSPFFSDHCYFCYDPIMFRLVTEVR